MKAAVALFEVMERAVQALAALGRPQADPKLVGRHLIVVFVP